MLSEEMPFLSEWTSISPSSDSIWIFGREFHIVEKIKKSFSANGRVASNVFSAHYIVVSELDEIYELCMEHGLGYEEVQGATGRYYGFDMDLDEEKQQEFYNALLNRLAYGFNGSVEIRAGQRQSFRPEEDLWCGQSG